MSNFFEGDATQFVQARDIYGNVYQQLPPAHDLRPQVLPPPAHYRNNEDQLRRLDGLYESSADGVGIAVVLGAPGSGRSTLGTCWIHRNGERFPGGQFWVRLGRRPVTEVLAELLGLAGYQPDQLPASMESRSALWRAWSANRKLVLFLDDAMGSAAVLPLLPAGPGSMVLVVEAGPLTELRSRHSVHEVSLEPLENEAALGILEALIGAERMAAEPEQRDKLVEVCAGSAAELNVAGAMLAAAPSWRIERLVGRIARKGTLANPVFDVAWDRMPADAQACYRVFGAHPGDGDVARETLSGVLRLDEDDVDDALVDLSRAKLVEEQSEGRYLMTVLARRHATTKAGDLPPSVVGYYAVTALALAEQVVPRGWARKLWPGSAPAEVSVEQAERQLKVERGNLAAAAHAAYELEAFEDVCRLAFALWAVHKDGEYPAEMIAINRLAVAAAEKWGSPLARSLAHTQWGFGLKQWGDHDNAVEQFRLAAECGGDLPDAYATAIESLGIALADFGRIEEAEPVLRKNLELALENPDDDRRVALARFHLAKVVSPDEAGELLDQAEHVLGAEPGNSLKILLWRGRKALAAGEVQRAVELLAEVARIAGEQDRHRERIAASRGLAEAARTRGALRQARAHGEDALSIAQLHGFTQEAVGIRDWLGKLRH